MYTKNKIVRVCALLFSVLIIFACVNLGTPPATEPQTLPPSMTPIPLEVTLTPFPPPLPDATFTQPPIILPADTLVPTIFPSPTHRILGKCSVLAVAEARGILAWFLSFHRQ
jgi:hypothetical protein